MPRKSSSPGVKQTTANSPNIESSKLAKSSSLTSIFSSLGKKRKRSDIDVNSTPNTPRSSISSIWSPSRAQSTPTRRKRSIFSLVKGGKFKKLEGSQKVEGSEIGNMDDKRVSEEEVDEPELPDSTDSTISHRAKKRRTVSSFDLKEKEFDDLLEPQYRKFRPKGFKFNPPPQDRSIRIYADGVFDLFHLGHMKQLEQAKKALPNVTLICGVPSDVDTHKHKGLTVLSDSQRCETLLHCKWVDEVIPDAPWCVTVDFLKKHHIDYVAHDDLPYASEGNDDIYRPVKELGMFLTTQRTEGISTSDIITKIIRDYDKYLMRNFARGATRKDLNVSWLKKNELDLKRHVNEFRESFKTNFESTTRDLYSEFMGYISGALHFKEEGEGYSDNGSDSDSDKDSDGDNEDANATDVEPHPGSPATDFASGYSGGSFFGNVKDWVSRRIDSSIPPSPTDTPRVHSDEE